MNGKPVNFMGLEASVNVETGEDGEWTLVMTAPEIDFKAAKKLPDGFPTFAPERQRYWSNRVFKGLEKELAGTIRRYQSRLRQMKQPNQKPPGK